MMYAACVRGGRGICSQGTDRVAPWAVMPWPGLVGGLPPCSPVCAGFACRQRTAVTRSCQAADLLVMAQG
jgi:hypothetical protein